MRKQKRRPSIKRSPFCIMNRIHPTEGVCVVGGNRTPRLMVFQAIALPSLARPPEGAELPLHVVANIQNRFKISN